MAVDGCAAVSKSDVIAGLCYLAEVCSGRIAVEVSEVVKSTRGMEVESVTVTKRLFEPTGALRAYELMGRCLAGTPSCGGAVHGAAVMEGVEGDGLGVQRALCGVLVCDGSGWLHLSVA